MHLCRGMTIGAFHTPLTEVHIRFDIFVLAHILIANAAAVTGCAIASERGGGIEVMTIDQSTTNRFGLAYVAITTRCVAARAVVSEHLFQGRVIFGFISGVDGGPVTRLRCVQAVGINC